MTKAQLRAAMRQQRRRLDPLTQTAHGESFAARIIRTPQYLKSRRIACYMPVFGELDTRPFMAHALACGREMYLPVIRDEHMWFTRWSGEALKRDRQSGLPQPPKRSLRLLNVRALDLVVVPLVAFHRSGARLGQGGGYYDRTFAHLRAAQWRQPTLIGAAHALQECDSIPGDPWDVPLDGVITEDNTFI